MKNAFEIRGEATAVFLRHKVVGMLETIIDTADLPTVCEIPGRIAPHVVARSDGTTRIYAVYQREGKRRQLHRMLCEANGLLVDHKNGNGLDNRRQNLRAVTSSINSLNRYGPNNTNKTSGIRGVHLHKQRNKWRSQVWYCRKIIDLGLFDTKEAAAAAFNAKLAELDRDSMPSKIS